MIYAGIGSRETPKDILIQMTGLAKWMCEHGWFLRSGGANGADEAFENGADRHRRMIYLPWNGFNGRHTKDRDKVAHVFSLAILQKVKELHPAPHKLTNSVMKLHSRNVAMITGPNMNEFVQLVVCYTKDAKLVGGTAMGIRVANEFNIPVLNYGELNDDQVRTEIKKLEKQLKEYNPYE